MAPHSSTLAWKIPWTKEPRRLQSMGSQRADTTERLHFHFSLSCIGEGHGDPLQYSCLENPRNGGPWWAAVYGVAQSRTRLKRLSSSSSIVALQHCVNFCCIAKWISCIFTNILSGFPGGSVVKNLPALWETWFWPLSQENLLEKGMVTHCSILAWRTPWSEEPWGLQSMGLQRARHHWVSNTHLSFGFPSHLGHHRALRKVPCAIQQVLIGYLFYTQYQ